MSILSINQLTLRIAGRTLLDHASLQLDPGRKIGLIGRNGAGKSTLLAAIAGDISPDGGDITQAARTRLGRVRQHLPEGKGALIDIVLASDTERETLMAQVAAEDDPIRLADAHERLLAIQAHAAPARAATILAGLGFDAAAQQRTIDAFSGGWQMRVALACALFLDPDLLLLDEPSNHLDIEATMWLEGWLKSFRGAAIIVSHDRELLDHVVDGIAHLEHGKLTLTPGGYAQFVRIRMEQTLQHNREVARVEAQKAQMQAFVDRFRAKATKARQAQSRLKALERLPAMEAIIEPGATSFTFPDPGVLPPPLLTMTGASTGYEKRTVLRDLSFRLDATDRIALLGQNGQGKSTFIKLIAGVLAPFDGAFFRAPKLRVGYYAQHQSDELVAEETAVQHLLRTAPKMTQEQARAQLARFGLDAHRAETEVRNLSGGERARLLLSLTTHDAPHVLLLDEPTNHLDIDAREALVRALNGFEGAVILISHDTWLVEAVTDHYWLVESGYVTYFDGTLDDYRARRQTASGTGQAGSAAQISGHQDRKESRKDRAATRQQQAPLRKRLQEVEKTLSQCSKKAEAYRLTMSDPAFYEKGTSEEITRVNKSAAENDAAIAKLEEEWLSLSEKIEQNIF